MEWKQRKEIPFLVRRQNQSSSPWQFITQVVRSEMIFTRDGWFVEQSSSDISSEASRHRQDEMIASFISSNKLVRLDEWRINTAAETFLRIVTPTQFSRIILWNICIFFLIVKEVHSSILNIEPFEVDEDGRENFEVKQKICWLGATSTLLPTVWYKLHVSLFINADHSPRRDMNLYLRKLLIDFWWIRLAITVVPIEVFLKYWFNTLPRADQLLSSSSSRYSYTS
jgi:hypothetical protein